MIKVVNPDVELWSQKGYDLNSIYDHIARCARVCYQSTPKDKNESSYDFLKRTILRGKDIRAIKFKDISNLHLSVFEHGTVHLRIPKETAMYSYDCNRLVRNKFNKYNIIDEKENGYCYLTTNLRVIIESGFIDYLKYIDDDDSHIDCYPQRFTFNITTDIGCSRELNRHRTHSISEESTRYCRYTANKFGNNISVIRLPNTSYNDYETSLEPDSKLWEDVTKTILPHYTSGWDVFDWYTFGIQIANLVYAKCIEKGWSAQQARAVLPLNTKTQLVHTAYLNDWINFLNLRLNEVSGKVHPMMKIIAHKLKEELDYAE